MAYYLGLCQPVLSSLFVGRLDAIRDKKVIPVILINASRSITCLRLSSLKVVASAVQACIMASFEQKAPVIGHRLARPASRATLSKVWHAGYSPEGHLYYWLTLVDSVRGDNSATCTPVVECVTWDPPDVRIGWCPCEWIRGSDGRRVPVRWKSELPSPAWRLQSWHPRSKRHCSAPPRPCRELDGVPADEDEVMSDSELYLLESKQRIWKAPVIRHQLVRSESRAGDLVQSSSASGGCLS